MKKKRRITTKMRNLTIIEYVRKPKENSKQEKEQELDPDPKVIYGDYEKGGWMEKDFWYKYLAKREKDLQIEEDVQRERDWKKKRDRRRAGS